MRERLQRVARHKHRTNIRTAPINPNPPTCNPEAQRSLTTHNSQLTTHKKEPHIMEKLELQEPILNAATIQRLLDKKMGDEKHAYLNKVGKFQAKLKSRRYWKAVFEAGGSGEEAPKMQDSGIPYLVLQMFHPTSAQCHKDFLRGRASLPAEKQEELRKLSAAKIKAREEEMMQESLIETPLDEKIKGLIPAEQLATLSYEQKQSLALAAEKLSYRDGPKIITP